MRHDWCPVCCTRHGGGRQECPGALTATGSERRGFSISVDTPHGIEAYGVLIAPSGAAWRARILTLPNILWVVPGRRQTLKFVGSSPEEAERKAIAFIREHCLRRGFHARTGPARVESGAVDPELAAGVGRQDQNSPAPRKVRFLPIRFGVGSPTEAGGTGNLSETGLFIITTYPVDAGSEIRMLLDLNDDMLALRGEVRWMRRQHDVGRSVGMGVRLVDPPRGYLSYVRELN